MCIREFSTYIKLGDYFPHQTNLISTLSWLLFFSGIFIVQNLYTIIHRGVCVCVCVHVRVRARVQKVPFIILMLFILSTCSYY